ncbi:hypothetical protein [Paenibacillus tengchongensis]|uniref:hypothetical protein n=1 Tax=Paenibacillus tengchongensis TaxID=2608684 RepID=UPI00124E447A|nr:hypothetical protein [Paenibacillus tengchongensis]
MKRFLKQSFINDEDGFSAKDFLMVLFGGLYAVFLMVAFFSPFAGVSVSGASDNVIDSMDSVIMTIIGGVFAVQSVREFRKSSAFDPTSASTRMDDAMDQEECSEGTSASETTPRI